MPGILIGVVIALSLLAAIGIVRYLWFWRARAVSFYPEGRLLYLAHRGVPTRAPENTLPAFREAFRIGMDGIELDVMETADGVLVVSHDFELERNTEGAGHIWRTPYKVISGLNAAHRWVGKYSATPIPRLAEVLEILPEHVLINIELKTRRWINPGFEEKVVAMIRRYRLVKRTIISSYNPLSLMKVRWLEPEVAIGFIWKDDEVPWYLRRPILVNLIHPECIHPGVGVTTPERVSRAHRRGMRVNVWTVNNPDILQRLRLIGVDGIFTDVPEIVLPLGPV